MSILNVDKIQPIGSGSTVTVNATDTILTNAQAGVITATSFSGSGSTIDNIQIGVTGGNEIDTSSGNLTIDSAGGTTNITDILNVTGSHVNLETGSASTQMQLRFGTNAEKSRITVVAATNDGYTGSTVGETVFNTNSQLSFSALGSQALTITSGRNIGIGRTDPGHKLAIHGGSSSQLEIKGTEADIWLNSTGPSGVWRILGSTGTNTHRFRIYDNTNGKEPFYIEGSSGSNTQHVHVNSGNLVFDAHGTGINFAANTNDESGAGSISANGEILDDYEEGSWTPVADGAGTITSHTGTSITYAGFYTKVGRVVHLEFYANVASGGSMEISSYKIFSGLPFATGSGNYGTGRIMTEDGEQLARQGDIIVGGSGILINKCGSSSGTVRLGGTVTYIAT